MGDRPVEAVLYCQVSDGAANPQCLVTCMHRSVTVRRVGHGRTQEVAEIADQLSEPLSPNMHGSASRPSLVMMQGAPDLPSVSKMQALHKLVVVLRGSAGRAALEALRPEPHVLERAYTGGSIRQVVVTTAGALPA